MHNAGLYGRRACVPAPGRHTCDQGAPALLDSRSQRPGEFLQALGTGRIGNALRLSEKPFLWHCSQLPATRPYPERVDNPRARAHQAMSGSWPPTTRAMAKKTGKATATGKVGKVSSESGTALLSSCSTRAEVNPARQDPSAQSPKATPILLHVPPPHVHRNTVRAGPSHSTAPPRFLHPAGILSLWARACQPKRFHRSKPCFDHSSRPSHNDLSPFSLKIIL